MRLQALRLHGFKSFADRTEIRFHDGITAVVGPNGCGKSNISDAIRWVLGEQRPSAIRGARMEEAIFQGTVRRRPVNRGTVALEVSNEDGTLPVPYQEVELSRVVFRDGGSEYFINRSSCRLKDIQELCRDTGLGLNAYSVIERTMIDSILSDRADERRSLFEEAAGIGKYKDRRKAAVRGLEQADHDLQRLEDVISEVETKVRSLARQKGRAERYRTLRARRLDLEVAVARAELARLEGALEERRATLRGDRDSGESLAAEVSTAETEHERLRLRQLEAERERGAEAAALEEVRGELVRLERDLAVAAERLSNGEGRLERLGTEGEEASRRLLALETEAQQAAEREMELAEELREVQASLDACREQTSGAREAYQAVRSELEELEREERELARRDAQLEGAVESAAGREEELELQLRRAAADRDEADRSLRELRDQGDLFAGRVEGLESMVERRGGELEEARERLGRLRAELEAAREVEARAREEESDLAGRARALERMERDREGLEPVVRAALERPGVEGLLTDFLEAPAELARAVEAYLGVLGRAMVVADGDAARDVGRWFGAWEGGGGLVLLPADRSPEPEGEGTLLERIEPRGAGAGWVRFLLSRVDLVEDGSAWTVSGPEDRGADHDQLTPSGVVAERHGALRLGNPAGVSGTLERQEALREVQARLESARGAAEDAATRRKVTDEAVGSAQEEVDRILEELREARDDLRAVRSEADARAERTARLERGAEDLARQVQGLEVALDRVRERARKAAAEREELRARLLALASRREEVGSRVESAEQRWEAARGEEGALRVTLTRAEGAVEHIRERKASLSSAHQATERRLAEFAEEEEALRDELARLRATRSEGEARLETLFQRRSEAEERLRGKEDVVESVLASLEAAERRLRQARVRERETTERRHRVELEAQEVEGRIARIRDRLEGEWDRTFEELVEEAEEVEGEPGELRSELQDVSRRLERLGPVNMLAVEEHEEERQRLDFLRGQRDDLLQARRDLRSAIQEINRTATRRFDETFESIRENFRATFERLFQGGECDLRLDDPEDPLESPIEIQASPKGKRTQRIHLLSGGERALTALALLFGIYLVKPSPFCVLDEVDAPLDESNIGRFIHLLEEFKEQTQFVVITHNPRTIEAADWIYGVTMEEPGVSTMVGVQLQEALDVSGSAA